MESNEVQNGIGIGNFETMIIRGDSLYARQILRQDQYGDNKYLICSVVCLLTIKVMGV